MRAARFALDQVRDDAFRESAERHSHGKIVLLPCSARARGGH